jgi:hypothetical protein
MTLNQAAREAGKSKATILDAIRGGRLSAPKDDLGRYQIDPAELFRVWPPTGNLPADETETDRELPPADHPRPDIETALLRQQVQFLERIIHGVERERDDLRGERERLLKVIEEQAGTVKLLTHQPAPKGKATYYWWWFWVAVILTILSLAAAPFFWPVLRQAPAIHSQDEEKPPPQKQPATEPKPQAPLPPLEPWKPDDSGG